MVTIVILVLALFVGTIIWGIEKYNEQKFIANAVDKNAPSPNYITPEFQALIDQLKEPGKVKHNRIRQCLILSDGQELSYHYEILTTFQNRCDLNFEPTRREWRILQGIVKKFYSEI